MLEIHSESPARLRALTAPTGSTSASERPDPRRADGGRESDMRNRLARWAPVALGVALAIALVSAIAEGGRLAWITVALLALALAASLIQRSKAAS